MTPHKETFKELLSRLEKLLILYENAQPDEIHLFNLLEKRIAEVCQGHISYQNPESRIKTLINRFNYPRELPKGEVEIIHEVDLFTLSRESN